MAGPIPAPPSPDLANVNLQTLVSAIQNSVQAEWAIATNIVANTTALTANTTAVTAAINALTTAFSIAFPAPLSSSATWDPPNLASGTAESTTVTVAGASLGNYVQVSFNHDLQGLTLDGYVSAANTVTAVLSNLTGGSIDLASGLLKVRVTTV
jgi:hypothetical protein